MNSTIFSTGPIRQILCFVLAISLAGGPSTAALAQTNAAAQAVRQRVTGGVSTDRAQEESPRPTSAARDSARQPSAAALAVDPTAAKIDTAYVAQDAIAVAVLRPAQLMAAPAAQLLPVEVATAAGLKYLGFDPADVDEVVAFAQMPAGESPVPGVPSAPGYGVTIKFTKPFKGSSIPASLRGTAKLGELGGRKYLQGPAPTDRSLYAPDSTTLVIAPDATLRQLVETKDQAKSGPVINRVQAVPMGNDLYVAVDMAALRPLMAIALMQAAQQVPPDAPPEVQQLFEAPNLVSAAELTFNLSSSSPVSLVVEANDDAAAQRLESMVDTGMKLYQGQMQAKLADEPAMHDPIQQALARYQQRMASQWAQNLQPTREGAQLTFFKSDDDGEKMQQYTQAAVIGVLVALLLPAIQAAREAARRNAAAAAGAPPDQPTFEDRPGYEERR